MRSVCSHVQAAGKAELGDEAATGTAGDAQDTAADMEMSEGAAAAAAAGKLASTPHVHLHVTAECCNNACCAD